MAITIQSPDRKAELELQLSRHPALEWLLRGSVALVLLGRAWQHLHYDTPLSALFFSPALLEGAVRDGLGMDWQTWAASQEVRAAISAVEHAQGVLYGLGALVALLPLAGRFWGRVQAGLLVGSSLGLCGLSLLHYLDHKRQLAQVLELGIQIGLPLLLALVLRERGLVTRIHQRGLRLAIAATFAGHGLYAVGYHEVPGGFVTMVMRSLGVAEPVARGLLFGAGCLDFAVAVGVLAGARLRGLYRAMLAYAALWGTLTALARVWSYFRWDLALDRLAGWLHETALRLPHGLVPLFVLLVLLQGRKAKLACACSLLAMAWPARAAAEHGRYRLTWRDDPATTMVVAWDQQGGSEPRLHWDSVDHGANVAAYAGSRAPDRVVQELGMNNHFVRLTGLSPDTAYYFVVADSSGPSARYWFKTAPATMTPFTVVAGGDSRNNREPRRNGNRAVAKLRPLLVTFGGDYTESNNDVQWQEWFDDWQSSISPDGRMYPLIATRGNHDSNAAVERLWDSPNLDVYFGLSVAGGLARFYTLNSEIAPGGEQARWLTGDLANHRCDVFRMAQYHRPMRPHTSGKAEGDDLYDAWAQLFADEGMDLVVECDSHTVKRTWPLTPAADAEEGFLRDDARGTVYIGEGCWGAPLRESDDTKSWTRAHGSFNEVNWLHYYPDRIEVRTVLTDDIAGAAAVSDVDPFATPAGLPLWDAEHGGVLTVPARARDPRCGPAGSELERNEVIGFGADWRYHDQGDAPGDAWREPDFDDAAWPIGPAPLGFGDGNEATPLQQGDPNVPSYYFRARFELPAGAGRAIAADLQTRYDDGIAVWLNGALVFTAGVGELAHGSYASSTQEAARDGRRSFDVAPLREGRNVIAVMVKQGSATSSDLAFDLALTLTLVKPEPEPPQAGGAGSGGASSAGSGGALAGSAGSEAGGTSAVPMMMPPGARPSDQPATPMSAPGGLQALEQGCACGVSRSQAALPWLALGGLASLLVRRARRK